MNRKDLYNGFNEVDDDILERSETASRSTKKPVWLKWGAIAACLCLMVAGAALWNNSGMFSSNPSGVAGIDEGAGVGVPGGDGMWPEGVDPVVASVAVIPAGVDLLDVADATSVSISEEDARAVEDLGAYLPNALPIDCRYGKAGYYETIMKDGTRYHMLRVTYESGEAPIPAPVPENAESASEMTGNTAFLWMVWGHRPDTDRPVYQLEEVSASLIEQQGGRVFYIDYDGIYVGIEKLDISAEELFAVIESIG